MNVTFKVNEKLTVEFDSSGVKEVFEELASISEILSEAKCGACGSTNLKYQVREVDGNKFYEIRCADCGATLSFGQHKKGGTLFPRRKDSDGKPLAHGGWVKWEGKKN